MPKVLYQEIGEMFGQIKERYDICTQCELFDKETKLCDECGCYMPFKVTLPLVSCPIGKWGNKKEEENKEQT